MPVSEAKIPKMCHHRSTGRAFVRFPGVPGQLKRMIYLGPWGSAVAQDRYDALVKEWLANDRQLPEAMAKAPTQVTCQF